MKIWLPCLFNVFLFLYGIYRVKQELGVLERPLLTIAVQDQEDMVEFIIRYVVGKIRSKALPCRLVVLVGESRDYTALLVTKMSREMSFIVREINIMQEGDSIFLDLRQCGDYQDIFRLLQDFPEWVTTEKRSLNL